MTAGASGVRGSKRFVSPTSDEGSRRTATKETTTRRSSTRLEEDNPLSHQRRSVASFFKRRKTETATTQLASLRASKTPLSAKHVAAPKATNSSAFDEARTDIKQNLDFATLCSALETGVPTRVSAAISLIADGTVTPNEFFHPDPVTGKQRCVIDSLLEMYASPRRPDLSRFSDLSQFPERLAPTEIERLSSDINCLQQLLVACKQSPHPKIQNVASDYEVPSACMFMRRVASMPSEHQAEAINLVTPMLDDLLSKVGHENAMGQGSDMLTALRSQVDADIHPAARATYLSYALKFSVNRPLLEQCDHVAFHVLRMAELPPEHHVALAQEVQPRMDVLLASLKNRRLTWNWGNQAQFLKLRKALQDAATESLHVEARATCLLSALKLDPFNPSPGGQWQFGAAVLKKIRMLLTDEEQELARSISAANSGFGTGER